MIIVDMGIDYVDFAKIDLEGHELPAQGWRNYLSTNSVKVYAPRLFQKIKEMVNTNKCPSIPEFTELYLHNIRTQIASFNTKDPDGAIKLSRFRAV